MDHGRQRIARRPLLLGLGATATWIGLGCGYAPEAGVAFEPWDFPDGETRPPYLAVAAAVLAASPHNTQPWRFRITDDRVDLFADRSRHLGPMDPFERELVVGLGCAIENMVVAATHAGRAPSVELLPDPADPDHVASVVLGPVTTQGHRFFDAIANRHTNRGPYLNDPAPGLVDALQTLVEEPEVSVVAFEDEARKNTFIRATVEATRAIVDDVEMNEASHAWYRHSAEDIAEHRDGTTIDATGLDATLRSLGKSQGRPDAASAGAYWIAATEGRQATGSAFVALVVPDRFDTRHQLTAGRVYQRMHLWATTQGVAMQPLNQLLERQDREQQLGLEPRFAHALAELVPSGEAIMLFRVGFAWDEAFASPRRSSEEVTT